MMRNPAIGVKDGGRNLRDEDGGSEKGRKRDTHDEKELVYEM